MGNGWGVVVHWGLGPAVVASWGRRGGDDTAVRQDGGGVGM